MVDPLLKKGRSLLGQFDIRFTQQCSLSIRSLFLILDQREHTFA